MKIYERCPVCNQSQQDHRLRKVLCPEISCGCKNCYWCGHQIQMVDWAIDLDHAEALKQQEVSHVA